MRLVGALSLSLEVAIAAAQLQPRQTATIPDFVTKYAPLVYLDQNEVYLPSDIQAQLNNTYPALNLTALPKADVPSPLSSRILSNSTSKETAVRTLMPVPSTSLQRLTRRRIHRGSMAPLPDPVTGKTQGVTLLRYHFVDAFYMYFYAFNLGDNIYGQLLGNHVGDWEHSMVRFQNGTPISVWLSQHEYGQAFTYNALSKKGVRPIIYSAIGGHPNFAVPGLHSRNVSVIVVNDTTSAGPLWDPTLAAYFYTYTPSGENGWNGTFVPSDASTPVDWLHFEGRWGDEQYLDSDPRQVNYLNASIAWKWESGPTGPLDKQLNRSDICWSATGTPCVTLTELPKTSGSSVPVTVTRTTGTGSVPTGKSSGTGTSTGAPKSTSSSAAARTLGVDVRLNLWVAVVALLIL